MHRIACACVCVRATHPKSVDTCVGVIRGAASEPTVNHHCHTIQCETALSNRSGQDHTPVEVQTHTHTQLCPLAVAQ